MTRPWPLSTLHADSVRSIMFKASLGSVIICAGILLALSPGSLGAQTKTLEPERAIITAVTGSVTYVRSSQAPEPQPVTLFLSLEEGDRLNLAFDARVNVLFLARGLGETWHGPRTLLFQDGQLLAQTRGVWTREQRPNRLKSLVFEPQKALSQSILLSLLKQPDETVRATPPSTGISKNQAAEIEKTYAILRQEFGDDDVTPDLYRLSVLAGYGDHSRMQPLLQDLLSAYPDNPALLVWQQWVTAQD
jgi:hypothetical protein